MTVTCLLAANPRPSDEEIVDGLAGNLCRCTGYQTIVAGVHHAVATLDTTAPDTAAPETALETAESHNA